MPALRSRDGVQSAGTRRFANIAILSSTRGNTWHTAYRVLFGQTMYSGAEKFTWAEA
jgi:hypothetical protein